MLTPPALWPRFLQTCFNNWYTATRPPLWARVVAGWFARLSGVRRILYACGCLPRYRAPVPVIIVGNITVGGTGKTPLVLWLVKFLQARGFQPGIVCRGYGGHALQWPQRVTAASSPRMVGDEAVLLAQQAAGVPVVAAPKRAQAAKILLQDTSCDIIVCDDGLQHYALKRDIEIVVMDGQRRAGNGYVLPAGPLREPVSRLQQADFVLVYGVPQSNEFGITKHISGLRRLGFTEEVTALTAWRGRQVHAVAGIGHPQQFFDRLTEAGLRVIPHVFPDHWAFSAADVSFDDGLPVVMTEKDAVKCRVFDLPEAWSAVLEIEPDARWLPLLEQRVTSLKSHYKGVPSHG